MRMLPLLVLALLASCSPAPQPPAVPPTPSTPPPPPPERVVNATTVVGMVRSSEGHPVPFAVVNAEATNSGCEPTGAVIGAVADARGEFAVTVDGPVGPAYHGCVRVTAESGGASANVTVPAFYTSSKVERVSSRAEVRLAPPAPLDRAEAERLAQRLAQAVNEPASDASGELGVYVAGGPEALRVALDQYRQILGGVASLREVPAQEWYRNNPHFRFELRGENGRTSRLDVHQEALTRLQSLLVNYGIRAEAFAMAYVRAISSGDALQLSRILNPDDVDFPVERAREMIVAYRQRYDTGTLRTEFVDIDEARGRFTFRIFGRSTSGAEASETLELQTGDGLIGVVGL